MTLYAKDLVAPPKGRLGGTSVTLCWVTLVYFRGKKVMIKINYFDERELLVRREIETKASKNTEGKGTQVLHGPTLTDMLQTLPTQY